MAAVAASIVAIRSGRPVVGQGIIDGADSARVRLGSPFWPACH